MTPSIDVYLAATRSTDGPPSMVEILLDADPIVQLDLLVLVVMSLVCWGVIGAKWWRLRDASAQTRAFVDAYHASRDVRALYEDLARFAGSPVAALFRDGYDALKRAGRGDVGEAGAQVERAMRRASQQQADALQRWITVLATTGSTAPFIGLFGTVWGILQAFLKLGQPGATATIQVVGPDIAHALVATAVGLVAAIPAVMAYNGFSAWIRRLDTEMDMFAADFLNRIRPSASR